MQHTLPPPPPPQAPPGDPFYRDLLRWLALFLAYPFYRPVTNLPRTWNEMANQMDETPLEDEVYTASLAELCTHATVVAPTRAGKTYNVTIPLIEFTDRLEGAGIFIDAKGDDLTGPKFDGMYPGAF